MWGNRTKGPYGAMGRFAVVSSERRKGETVWIILTKWIMGGESWDRQVAHEKCRRYGITESHQGAKTAPRHTSTSCSSLQVGISKIYCLVRHCTAMDSEVLRTPYNNE